MNRSGLALLAVCAAFLAACGGEPGGVGEEAAVAEREVTDRTAYEELDIAADTAEYGEPGAAPVTPVQGGRTVGGPLTATGNLRGIAANFPPGTIAVTEQGPGTLISITIDRYTADTELQASIVRGSCASPGPVVQTLPETIRVGADGVAVLNSRVDIPTRQLLDGRHSVRVHNPGATPTGAPAPEVVLACADLPAADAG